MVKPSKWREMAQKTLQSGAVSIRKACDIFDISEHCYRYKPKLAEGDALISKELLRLTQLHNRAGALAYATCTYVTVLDTVGIISGCIVSTAS